MKTGGIRPGTLCLLVGTENPDINGRIVTAVRYVPHELFMSPSGLTWSDAWELAAPWIDRSMPNHARPKNLLPIAGPDVLAGLDETVHDSIVRPDLVEQD